MNSNGGKPVRSDGPVPGEAATDFHPETADLRTGWEENEVALAPAVARTETWTRVKSLSQAGHEFGPLMLSANGVGREPDGLGLRSQAEIIDVPVGPAGAGAVMEAAGPETAGSEGAADVHIPAREEVKRTKLPRL